MLALVFLHTILRALYHALKHCTTVQATCTTNHVGACGSSESREFHIIQKCVLRVSRATNPDVSSKPFMAEESAYTVFPRLVNRDARLA